MGAEGDRVGPRLFHDVRNRGYVGSLSHLERLLSTWRSRLTAWSPPDIAVSAAKATTGNSEKDELSILKPAGLSPRWSLPFLRIKPTPTLTSTEAAKMSALKEASPSFVATWRSADEIPVGILQGSDADKLGRVLDDARRSGLSIDAAIRADRPLRDIEAVRKTLSRSLGAAARRKARSIGSDAQARHGRRRRHRTPTSADASSPELEAP